MAATEVERNFRETTPEMRVVLIGAEKDVIVFSHPDLFDIGEMRSSFRALVTNSGIESGLCKLGFVRLAIRSSVTLAGDTYDLNCSGPLPSGRTSGQANESETKPAPAGTDLKIRYDKFKDVTYVSTNDLMIAGVDSVANKRPQQLTMVLSYFCHGNTNNCSPRTMELVFVGKTSFWEYKSTHDLVFILDGKRMSVPRPDWEGKVMSADDLREYMDCQISSEAIRRLAAARDVEGELGFTAFKLNQDHLSALRTLLKDVHRPTAETH